MKRVYCGVVALLMASPAFGQADVSGSKNYPGISRMPGYYIANYEESPFDSFNFRITERGQQKEQAVEGRRVSIRYNLTENAPMPSQLQVLRNYQSAARAAGGQVAFDDGENTTLRLSKGGSETWIYIQAGNRPSGLPIFFDIIEKKAMQQDVTIDAKAMATGLAETGRVALYGIFFDTGKAELKPESAPALAEIAKLLKDNAALKVYVVGHTDMAAELAGNVKLSQARAQAVVSALETQNGIAGARLIAFGAGPYAPVTTNKTEEGRAKNRRVELVEIATR